MTDNLKTELQQAADEFLDCIRKLEKKHNVDIEVSRYKTCGDKFNIKIQFHSGEEAA